MKNLFLIAPEIFLSLVALLIILGEAFWSQAKRLWFFLAQGSLLLILVYYGSFFLKQSLPYVGIEPAMVQGQWIQYPPLFNMISVDSVAIFFKMALLASVLLVLWLSMNFHEFEKISSGIYCALLLLGTVGMMLLVGSIDFLMAVISLELLGITSFVLTGFVVARRSSAEAAIKFFLVGSLSTAILLFGISYYYGYFGTTSIAPFLAQGSNGVSVDMGLTVVVIFLVAGLGFKLAMVPFHMWAPDAYEGAPTPITAFLSVAPKVAVIGFFLRVLGQHEGLNFTIVLAVLAALTMTVGNVGALLQTNMKRLLAYSSIAQVGYILVALVAGGSLGVQSAMLYTFVYLFMNLGVFTVLIILSNASKSDEVSSFSGLYKKSLGLSLVLLVFLLSMTGIPPLAGFIGKFAIFSAVIKNGNLLWLGVAAVLNSVVSLYYYFRIAHQMFFIESVEKDTAPIHLSPALACSIAVALAVTLLAGLFPNPLLGWVRNLVGS